MIVERDDPHKVRALQMRFWRSLADERATLTPAKLWKLG